MMPSVGLGPNNCPLKQATELYKDCRLGKYDMVVWGRPNGEVKIGKIEKLSKVTKKRSDDGFNLDQCGDPHFYYVYPKFHPEETIFKIRPIELKICDRHLKIGFLVKEIETGRVGYVQGIKQQITVKIVGYDLILRDLEFRDLIDPWKLNVQFKRPVYYSGWVGRIGCPVQRRVHLRFIDNKVRAYSLSIAWNELAHILVETGVIKMGTFSFESSGFAFWPGKKYKIPKKTLFSNKYKVNWQGDLKPPTLTAADGLITIRIYKTEVMPFRIEWIRPVPGVETEKPKETFTEEDIKDMIFIRPILTSCLGDVRMYRVKVDDYRSLITEDTWKILLRRRYWLPRPKTMVPSSIKKKEVDNDEDDEHPSLSPLELNEDVAVEIIYTRSTAEVAWIDGKISRIDSCKLCRVRSEYFEVGSFVEPITLSGLNTFGVIQQVKIFDNHSGMESSAVVKWFYFGNDDVEEPEEQTYETELPMKLLKTHSQFNFKSKTCMNVIVCRANAELQDFTAGFVVNTYPDGKLRIRCVDGTIRRFWPYEISRITPEYSGYDESVAIASSAANLAFRKSSFTCNSLSSHLDTSRSMNALNWRKGRL